MKEVCLVEGLEPEETIPLVNNHELEIDMKGIFEDRRMLPQHDFEFAVGERSCKWFACGSTQCDFHFRLFFL